jgi:hypothetical protein
LSILAKTGIWPCNPGIFYDFLFSPLETADGPTSSEISQPSSPDFTSTSQSAQHSSAETDLLTSQINQHSPPVCSFNFLSY